MCKQIPILFSFKWLKEIGCAKNSQVNGTLHCHTEISKLRPHNTRHNATIFTQLILHICPRLRWLSSFVSAAGQSSHREICGSRQTQSSETVSDCQRSNRQTATAITKIDLQLNVLKSRQWCTEPWLSRLYCTSFTVWSGDSKYLEDRRSCTAAVARGSRNEYGELVTSFKWH